MVPRVIAARDRFHPTANGSVMLKFELSLSRTQASLRQSHQRVRLEHYDEINGGAKTKGQRIVAPGPFVSGQGGDTHACTAAFPLSGRSAWLFSMTAEVLAHCGEHAIRELRFAARREACEKRGA